MSAYKLICEVTEDFVISEEVKNDKKYLFVEGIFLQGGIKNRNGRIYPISVLEKEVDRYVENYVAKNRALGELGHPEGPTINLERVSHKIVSIKQDGGNFVGKAKILESTDMGKIAAGLVRDGVQLGISSRGLGSLKPTKEGIMEVQDDFMLATAGDLVADPSAPDAWLNAVMENKEWVFENGSWREVDLNQVQKAIKKTSKSNLDEAKLYHFNKMLKGLITLR